MADRAWIESDLLSQTTALKSKAVNTSKSIAQLTEICQAQADELAGGYINISDTQLAYATHPSMTSASELTLLSLSHRSEGTDRELPQDESTISRGSCIKTCAMQLCHKPDNYTLCSASPRKLKQQVSLP